MTIRCRFLTLLVSGLIFSLPSIAQDQPNAAMPSLVTGVPHLVKFSGVLADGNNKTLADSAGVTFSLYKQELGGAPLWVETQNITPDKLGHYTVTLGAATREGIPAELFVSGEARWLGVQVQGQAEQPRVLLLSVPYALKAVDAETVGGLPPSAFLLAAAGVSAESTTTSGERTSGNTGGQDTSGSQNFIPIWTDDNGTLGNSALYQGGTANKPKLGIGTTKPSSTLDVKGGGTIRGTLSLPASGTATSGSGFNSQALNVSASAFNNSAGKAVNQTFQWRAEPLGNNSSSPSGTLNLLFASGSGTPGETGLNIASNGQITFASGQTFPGAGTITGVTTATGSGLTGGGTSGTLNLSLTNTCSSGQVLQWNGSGWACRTAGTGTITQVTAGTDLTGGGNSGNVTLNLDTAKVPQLNTANAFNGNQSISGNLSVTGSGSGMAASFTGNNNTQVGMFTQNGTGTGVLVQQNDTGSSTSDVGISAVAAGSNAVAIRAQATNSAGAPTALYGSVMAQNGTGVFGGALNSGGGTGVLGQALGASGGVGVEGLAASSTGIAGVFDNTGSGKVVSLRHNGAEVLSVDSGGNMQANGNITTQGGQAIIRSAAVPGIFNNSGGGTILIGQNNGTQKFSFDGGGNLATSGTVSASSFSGSGTGLTGVPQLASSNTFTGANTFTNNQTVQGSLSVGNSNTAITLNNTFTGDGIDITIKNSYGVNISGGNIGLYADNATNPIIAYTNSGTDAVFAENDADVSNNAAILGAAYGAKQRVFGVEGYATNISSAGVLGNVGGLSNVGQTFGGGAGVWADAGKSNTALFATADNSVALQVWNNGGTQQPTILGSQDGTGPLLYLESLNGALCEIDNKGNFYCSGSKSAAVPVDGGSRKVALYAVESPENWFEDFGTGRLSKGSAAIALDATFAQTVNTALGYHVFLTPRGECEGLYVANSNASGFEVRELRRGSSNVAFDYRIVVRRKGYENIRLEDVTAKLRIHERPTKSVPLAIPIPVRPVPPRTASSKQPAVRE